MHAPAAFAEARVRGRSAGGDAVRIAARARRRLDPLRAGRRARRLRGVAGDGAAVAVQSVHGGGSRSALRHAPEGRRPRAAIACPRHHRGEGGVRITEEEFAARRSAFAATLAERGLDGAVLFDPQYVHYYTGFFFIPTERPIAFALASGGLD